jgi:hypothetical protein
MTDKYKLEGISKETVVAHSNILSRNCVGGTEKTPDNNLRIASDPAEIN